MRILITGSKGFIGGAIKVHFQDGNELRCIDKLEDNGDPQCRRLNLLDRYNLEAEIISFSPEVIIHCAARTDLRGISLEDYEDNHVATENLIIAAERLEKKPFILFFSSMLVHSLGKYSRVFGDYNPQTIYGKSKVLVEELATRYIGDFVVLRPTSIWGPGFKEPYRDFFDLIRSKRFVGMPVSSMSKKTYGFIEDILKQIEFIIGNRKLFIKDPLVYLSSDYYIEIGNWANLIYNFNHNRHYPILPLAVFRVVGFAGDILVRLGIKFPMTSFRLKNMTSDNMIPFDERFKSLKSISLEEATLKTLRYLDEE